MLVDVPVGASCLEYSTFKVKLYGVHPLILCSGLNFKRGDPTIDDRSNQRTSEILYLNLRGKENRVMRREGVGTKSIQQ